MDDAGPMARRRGSGHSKLIGQTSKMEGSPDGRTYPLPWTVTRGLPFLHRVDHSSPSHKLEERKCFQERDGPFALLSSWAMGLLTAAAFFRRFFCIEKKKTKQTRDNPTHQRPLITTEEKAATQQYWIMGPKRFHHLYPLETAACSSFHQLLWGRSAAESDAFCVCGFYFYWYRQSTNSGRIRLR